MFYPQELEALLRYNGFRIEEKYGSLDGATFSDWSLKQVIICAAITSPETPDKAPFTSLNRAAQPPGTPG
jgi:hypothetical protein